MEIVKAKLDDLRELASFARSTYAEAFGLQLGASVLQQHLKMNMSDRHFESMLMADTFLLARRDAALVGFAQVGLVDTAYEKYLEEFCPSGCELRRLYVLSDLQSQGIGSELIQRAVKELMVSTASCVYLTTWESNHGAQKLYAKHHFIKVGQIPEYDANGNLNGYECILVRKFVADQ